MYISSVIGKSEKFMEIWNKNIIYIGKSDNDKHRTYK